MVISEGTTPATEFAGLAKTLTGEEGFAVSYARSYRDPKENYLIIWFCQRKPVSDGQDAR